jgi:hypothetical protein
MYDACDIYYALNFPFPAVTGVSSLQLLCATSVELKRAHFKSPKLRSSYQRVVAIRCIDLRFTTMCATLTATCRI